MKRISLQLSSLEWTGKPLMQRSGRLTTLLVIGDGDGSGVGDESYDGVGGLRTTS